MTNPVESARSLALSRREQAALDFIRRHIEQVGYAPSLRELGDGIELRSLSSVHDVLARLVKKGAVRRGGPRSPRAIAIVEPAGEVAS
jgi:repressor LexA